MTNIIIGGGLSGLYLTYKLQQLFPKYPLTILEKTNRVGGRVHTMSTKQIKYDTGAARYSYNHHIIKDLIKELHLEHNIIQNNKKQQYYVSNNLLEPMMLY